MNIDDIRRARDLLSKVLHADSGEQSEADIWDAMLVLMRASEDDLISVVTGRNPRWGTAEKLALRMFKATDTAADHAVLKYLCSKSYKSTVLEGYLDEDDERAARMRRCYRTLARRFSEIADELDQVEILPRSPSD